jgi:hypothetical protein
MRNPVVIAILLLGLTAGVAEGGAAPVVPEAAQARIKAKAASLAYAPTRIPIGFRYRSWQYRQGALRISFRNQAGWEITFVAVPLAGSCRRGMQKSFQLAGNKVYWSETPTEQQAWRCVARRNRPPVRLVAASPQPSTRLAAVGLGSVASSGKMLQ